MRAVGEVMSIGRTYKEALQKAVRSLEKDRYGLGYVKDFHERSKDELIRLLIDVSSERHFIMYEALRKGATVDEIYDITRVKRYFIEQMKELVDEEESIVAEAAGTDSGHPDTGQARRLFRQIPGGEAWGHRGCRA